MFVWFIQSDTVLHMGAMQHDFSCCLWLITQVWFRQCLHFQYWPFKSSLWLLPLYVQQILYETDYMLLILIKRDPLGKYCDTVSGKNYTGLWPCIPPSGSGSVSSCIDFHFSAALFGLLLIVWSRCQNEKEPRLHTSQTSIIQYLKSRWIRNKTIRRIQ